MPAVNAAARPLLRRRRTTWSTPWARATSDGAVARPVVDDQHLDRRRCRECDRGRSASVAGSVAASLRHGIWMISFFTADWLTRPTSFSITPSQVIVAAPAS